MMKFIKLFAVPLCLALFVLLAGTVYASDMLSHAEDIVRALRAADDARAAFEHTPRASGDYGRMEQAWREREYALEEARLRTLARETRHTEDELRALRRDGKSWEDISRHYHYDYKPDSLGIGKRKYNQYDKHDGPWHDHYKHPGKAKGHYKGTDHGPPGHNKDKHHDKHKGKHKGKHKDQHKDKD
jgi:hypothetical protein